MRITRTSRSSVSSNLKLSHCQHLGPKPDTPKEQYWMIPWKSPKFCVISPNSHIPENCLVCSIKISDLFKTIIRKHPCRYLHLYQTCFCDHLARGIQRLESVWLYLASSPVQRCFVKQFGDYFCFFAKHHFQLMSIAVARLRSSAMLTGSCKTVIFLVYY